MWYRDARKGRGIEGKEELEEGVGIIISPITVTPSASFTPMIAGARINTPGYVTIEEEVAEGEEREEVEESEKEGFEGILSDIGVSKLEICRPKKFLWTDMSIPPINPCLK